MSLSCSICMDNLNIQDAAATPCGHTFHYKCASEWVVTSANCPKCRKSVQITSLIKLYVDTSESDSAQSSQQVDQLVQQHQDEIQAQHGQHHPQQAMQLLSTSILPNTRGRIAIKIVKAKLTKNYGLVLMDPYVRVRVENTIFETNSNIHGGKTPTWNRVVNTYLPVGVESIYLQIFDKRAFKNDECIAWAHVILPEGIFSEEIIDEWYSLSGPQGEGKEGKINLVMNFTPVEVAPSQVHPMPKIPAKVQAGVAPGPLFTDEELNELHVMFLAVDKDVIQSILEEKRGDKDSTVTALLEMTSSPKEYAQINPMQLFSTSIPPNTRGRITIKIVEAKLTKNYGLVLMDLYVRVRIENTIFETKTSIHGGKTPTWNRVVNTYLPVGVESIYLQIFDERAFTNDKCIAWTDIILPKGIFRKETIDEWYSLSGPQGEGKEGKINLVMNFTPVEVVTPQVHPVPKIQQKYKLL